MNSGWLTLWSVVFWVVLGIFALLAVVVSWGGVGDLRQLFRALDEEHAGRDRDREQGPPR